MTKMRFLHTLFLENEEQHSEKNYRAMFFKNSANLEQKKLKLSFIIFYD